MNPVEDLRTTTNKATMDSGLIEQNIQIIEIYAESPTFDLLSQARKRLHSEAIFFQMHYWKISK